MTPPCTNPDCMACFHYGAPIHASGGKATAAPAEKRDSGAHPAERIDPAHANKVRRQKVAIRRLEARVRELEADAATALRVRETGTDSPRREVESDIMSNIYRGAQRPAATYRNHLAWELVGARIATCLEASGMTAVTLAERTGLTPNAIANAKTGSQLPLMTVVRIARALDVPIGELIPDGAV